MRKLCDQWLTPFTKLYDKKRLNTTKNNYQNQKELTVPVTLMEKKAKKNINVCFITVN